METQLLPKPDIEKMIAEAVAEPAEKPETIEPYDLTKWTITRFHGEPAPMKFLVSELIPQGIAGTIYSAGGSGKSTLALDLSLRVAIADKYPSAWLGKYTVNKGGKVLYFSAEEPDDILHKRVHGLASAIATETGITLDETLTLAGNNFYLLNLWGSAKQLFEVKTNSICPTEEYHRIYETLKASGAALVILDTRSRLSGAEGAGNAIVSAEVAHYEKLAADFGATVLLLHHTNKASYSFDTHAGAAQRGESAFLDCLRFGLYLQGMTAETAAQNGIAEAERGKYITLTHSKSNYTEIQQPIILCRDGWRFELTDYKPKASSDERRAKEEQADIDKIMPIVTAEPGITQREVIRRRGSGISIDRTRKALQNAESTGLLRTEPGAGSSIRYSPAGALVSDSLSNQNTAALKGANLTQ